MKETVHNENEVEFIRTDVFWEFLNNVQNRIDITATNKEAKTSELVKLLIFARREMLDGFCEFVELNSFTFKEVCSQMGFEVRLFEDS
jgi:hypothetical protein